MKGQPGNPAAKNVRPRQPCSLLVSASASVLVGLEISAGSYQDLMYWYCCFLTRRTMCRRAAGDYPEGKNTSRMIVWWHVL